jgi:hypothetical protein
MHIWATRVGSGTLDGLVLDPGIAGIRFFCRSRGGKKKLAGMEQGGKYNIVESNAFSFSLSFWSGAFGMNFISRRSAMNVHEAMHVTRLLFLIEFQEVSHFALA